MYNIIIDQSIEPTFGYDQAFVNYPTVFPTVTFRLMPTEDLVAAADKLMTEAGNEPADEYEFYLGINGFTDSSVDNAIVAAAIGSEETVDITLDEAEQDDVYAVLDRQCHDKFGKGCYVMLGKARKAMTGNKYEFGVGE